MTQTSVLTESNLPGIELVGRGKVRDVYRVGNDLLIVTSDRISAFDYILATGIPEKGRVLNQMTLFWLDHLKSLTPNHLITADVAKYPAQLQAYSSQLEGRSMLVRRAKMVEIAGLVATGPCLSAARHALPDAVAAGDPEPARARPR